MGKFNDRFEKIPLGIANFITVLAGIATIAGFVLALIDYLSSDSLVSYPAWPYIALISSFIFNIILFIRVRRYTKLETLRMSRNTKNMYRLLHGLRDTYFDVMHCYKLKDLKEDRLTEKNENELIKILDNLCSTMSAYTSRDVSACIKLITAYADPNEEIDINNATLVTFCRSENSDRARGEYEHNIEAILLRDNTDFLEIVSPHFEKSYFYQTDLEAYAKQLEKNGQVYKNSDTHWKNYYRSTIVVPIQIRVDKLYHIKKHKDAYHILGFLCLDSMFTDAFSESMENYYVDCMFAYADAIYILLGQYRHYLKKLQAESDNKPKGGEGNGEVS